MSVPVTEALVTVYDYARARDWKGDDPYDGLKSRVFSAMPFSTSHLVRLAHVQLFKRSPVNLRRLARVEPTHNPKALGLFISSASHLHRLDPKDGFREDADRLLALIEATQTEGWSGACWGYDFPWEARGLSKPPFAPTVVATAFVAQGLLDAWEEFGYARCLELARSACEFVLCDLNRTGSADAQCFSYSPTDTVQVYNASMLGAQLLARVGAVTGESLLEQQALSAARFVAQSQEPDGSWLYGTQSHHRWLDSFHTGYVLMGLAECAALDGGGDTQIARALEEGYRFYRDSFFGEDGCPFATPTERFPLDTRNAAQGIITLLRMGDVDRAQAVANWAIANLRHPSGYFFYRKGRLVTNRIPYMRWCQAFMALALARLEVAAR